MPGPIVDDIATPLRYRPLLEAGLARSNASSNATAFSYSWLAVKEALPKGACTIPAFSVRYSIFPPLNSLTAFPTSKVTVPVFGLGINPRGPSTFPRRPTRPMTFGVAIARSNSSQPPHAWRNQLRLQRALALLRRG